MDGENNGKPYEQMDDLKVFPLFLETTKWIWVGGGRGGWMNHLKNSFRLHFKVNIEISLVARCRAVSYSRYHNFLEMIKKVQSLEHHKIKAMTIKSLRRFQLK